MIFSTLLFLSCLVWLMIIGLNWKIWSNEKYTWLAIALLGLFISSFFIFEWFNTIGRGVIVTY